MEHKKIPHWSEQLQNHRNKIDRTCDHDTGMSLVDILQHMLELKIVLLLDACVEHLINNFL